jgi:hypothetical protein
MVVSSVRGWQLRETISALRRSGLGCPVCEHQGIKRYDVLMRTTLTLDPDVRLLVERRMRERGLSFKEAVNEALREGLIERPPSSEFHTRTFDLGEPLVPLDKALRLAGELEDEEFLRLMALKK